MPMAKTKAKTKAKAKAIKLRVLDTPMTFKEEWVECEVKMKETLSDLVAFIREDEEDAQADGEGLSDLSYVTTVEGKRISMKMKVAKLVQDGLISDGSSILIKVPLWPCLMKARCTCRSQ
jgi:hypothetical protein